MSTTAVQSIPTGAWKIDPVHSRVGFAVKHMVVSTFRGQFGSYDGRLVAGEDGEQEGRARAEAAKDGALADACRLGDLVDRDAVGAALGEEPGRGRQDALAVARGVRPLDCLGLDHR